MIIRTQDGWMINTKSVIGTVEEIGGHFHIETVALELTLSGATVIEKATSSDRVTDKVTIGVNQIRAILNTYANKKQNYAFSLTRHGQGWYEVN